MKIAKKVISLINIIVVSVLIFYAIEVAGSECIETPFSMVAQEESCYVDISTMDTDTIFLNHIGSYVDTFEISIMDIDTVFLNSVRNVVENVKPTYMLEDSDVIMNFVTKDSLLYFICLSVGDVIALRCQRGYCKHNGVRYWVGNYPPELILNVRQKIEYRQVCPRIVFYDPWYYTLKYSSKDRKVEYVQFWWDWYSEDFGICMPEESTYMMELDSIQKINFINKIYHKDRLYRMHDVKTILSPPIPKVRGR